jgi:hypothetical protein
VIVIKIIDLNESIYNLSKNFPGIVDELAKLGFTEIAKPGMINTVGRFMKLEQGCKLRKIDFEELKIKLQELGYTFKEDIK